MIKQHPGTQKVGTLNKSQIDTSDAWDVSMADIKLTKSLSPMQKAVYLAAALHMLQEDNEFSAERPNLPHRDLDTR